MKIHDEQTLIYRIVIQNKTFVLLESVFFVCDFIKKLVILYVKIVKKI